MKANRRDVQRLAIELLLAAGTPLDRASTVVDHLLEADAMGLRSHGVTRVPQYLAEIAAGVVDPAGEVRLEPRRLGRAHVDGGRTFGQVVGQVMVTAAAELAQPCGISLVTGCRMGHTGRIGAYPERLARSGLFGLAASSAPPSGHWVAPFGGREGRLGTNPIAFAFPAGEDSPVAADFSTAAVAEGVVRVFRSRAQRLPDGWLRDALGRPTTDPADLYAHPPGAIQPLGADLGYRGTALGLLVEVLGTILAGDDVDDPDRTGSNLAIVAVALDPSFVDRALHLTRHIRSSPPIDPVRPVMLPGDRERLAVASAGDIIDIDKPTWDALEEAASALGVALTETIGD